jgi:hypothetical protein
MLSEWTARLVDYRVRLDRIAGRRRTDGVVTRVKGLVRLRTRRSRIEHRLRALAVSPDPQDHVWVDRSIEDLGRAIRALEDPSGVTRAQGLLPTPAGSTV